MRPWASNMRNNEKRGKGSLVRKRLQAAPRVPRSHMQADQPPSTDQEGNAVGLAYAVELRFNHEGLEVGVDDVQICLSKQSLQALVEEYNEMGITFSLIVVIVQGETDQEEALPPGKLTKRWKRFILEQAARPGVTIAIAGSSPNPHQGGAVEPACLYIRSNYPRA